VRSGGGVILARNPSVGFGVNLRFTPPDDGVWRNCAVRKQICADIKTAMPRMAQRMYTDIRSIVFATGAITVSSPAPRSVEDEGGHRSVNRMSEEGVDEIY
jgi:hypothetical protein